MGGELTAVSVAAASSRRRIRTAEEERQRRNLLLAKEYGLTVTHVRGNVAEQLIGYCRAHQVGMLLIAHPCHSH